MGILSGLIGYIMLAALALGVIAVLIVAIVSAAKSGKCEDENKDEYMALAEYEGVDGFVAPKAEVEAPAAVASDAEQVISTDENDVLVAEEAPVAAPQTQSQPTTPPPEAPITTDTAPVEDLPADSTPVANTAVAGQDIKHEDLTQENPIAADTVPVEQRQGDWSNYDGEYDGYYYDPIDAVYYEGNPPVYVQKMYLPPAPEPIVRKIANPAAPMMNKPRSPRAAIVKQTTGLDSAIIYGQYVIEHIDDEYFFTLYSNKDVCLYESFNYANEQYCRDAVKRFRKHVLAGAFSVEEKDGKFHFVLVRKLNTYYGPDKETRVDADQSIADLKYYAQTDLVRIQ